MNHSAGATRPLRAALRTDPAPAELLALLGYPALGTQLPAEVTVSQLLDKARHLAALRRHPYISPDHVAMSAAHTAGDFAMAGHLGTRLK